MIPVSLYTVELILSTGGLSKRRKAGRVGLSESITSRKKGTNNSARSLREPREQCERRADIQYLAEEVVLVAPVHAVVLMVAHPGRHDAPLVVTLKPVGPLPPSI